MNALYRATGHGRPVVLTLLAVIGLCLLLTVSALANNQTGDAEKGKESAGATTDVMDLSIEDLMDIKVDIASRKPEAWFDTAAAVYVLTGDEIRRSGATDISDALRLVPGLEVASIRSHTWRVSSRGFNDQWTNKLLVQIDGRTVYTPLFSGVFWDIQDVVMEDLDRIEVIRGPGATMWGANAVNGIINIITKPSEDTQGTMISETMGSLIKNISVLRYGGDMGKSGHYRVFTKYLSRGPFVSASGSDMNDKSHLLHGGFRADWDPSDRDQITCQGDIYNGALHGDIGWVYLTPPYKGIIDYKPCTAGGNFLGRWTRKCSEKTDMTLQAYFDQAKWNDTRLSTMLDTYDLDFQQHSVLSTRHDLVWGLGYRRISYNEKNSSAISVIPSSRSLYLLSAFAQDEMTLTPDRFYLTLGSKFERNYFNKFDIQPSIRFLWTPDSRHTGWAAVSRAVRTPSLVEESGRVNMRAFPGPTPPGLTYLASIFGKSSVLPEELLAYEVGYRIRPNDRLSVDLATFYNFYHRLTTGPMGTPFLELSPFPPHIVLPFYANNMMNGQSYGFELSANWRPRNWLQFVAGYSYFQLCLNMPGNAANVVTTYSEGQDPANQFFLRSSMDLPNNIQLDTTFRYVDYLPNVGGTSVPSYFEMDMRLAWQAKKGLEVALVGQNLLQNRHPEFGSSLFGDPSGEVPRSVYGNVTWKF